MKLAVWLDRQGISVAEFGRRIGKPQPTAQRYAAGARIPEPETMTKIAEITGGEVMPNDFYDVSPPTAPDDSSEPAEAQS
jgi:transcriptional regulator with XRE-family HTH domain